MKRAILVLGSICLLSVPLRAYIYTSVVVSDNYSQTQPGKLVQTSTGIYAGVIVHQFDGILDTADDVSVLKPNGGRAYGDLLFGRQWISERLLFRELLVAEGHLERRLCNDLYRGKPGR